MKAHKLLLTADIRGNQTILYKEFIGHKVFFKKPTVLDKDKKTLGTTFTKKVALLDLTTNKFRKQTVFLKVISITNKFLQVEVI